jgi:UDP-3-O-[3-hydroxymyristoyl] glucosamine N-acyltransferase
MYEVNIVIAFRLGDIAQHLRAFIPIEVWGDENLEIDSLSTLERATPRSITFLSNPRYANQLATTQAGCIIVGEALAPSARIRGACLQTPDPYLAFAKLTQWWAQKKRPLTSSRVHPTAIVHAQSQVHESVALGPYVVVSEGSVLAEGVRVGAHSFIGESATIGPHTRVAERVVFGHDCHIGAHSIIHSGAVIGADGFGFAPRGKDDPGWEKIEQLGGVRIGDYVEIGANTCIDRGAIEDTVIEEGVKLDNLIQIGHNVRVGAHTAMAAFTGVAGSATIGAHCTLGGRSSIMGHVTLANQVHISSNSFAMRSISQPGTYTGAYPLSDHASWEKNAATLRQLHALRSRIMALEKKLQQDENAI